MPLWLISLGLKVGGFLKANWKIIAIAVAVLAAVFLINRHINHLKEVAHDAGVQEERTLWTERTRVRNEENRRLEGQFQQRLDQFGERFSQLEQARIQRETTHTNTIREIVRDNPDLQRCQVPPEVLNERNAIRRMGPAE